MTLSCARACAKEEYFLTKQNPSKVLLLGDTLIGLALLTISIIGAAGAFPGNALGWTALGLASGGYLLELLRGALCKRTVTLLEITVYTLGCGLFAILGVAGVLSGATVGVGLLCLIGLRVSYRIARSVLLSVRGSDLSQDPELLQFLSKEVQRAFHAVISNEREELKQMLRSHGQSEEEIERNLKLFDDGISSFA